eukprot:TRINITY_DN39_c0_g1_i1.p1 TRINITY_DN39_c0_g1~~TRINITY_DN39_c0_g1_i1.p1  ORF type:complete len:190 (+),score=30.15 TRINITY_DN39_c0_g1_i1:277-846(+)
MHRYEQEIPEEFQQDEEWKIYDQPLFITQQEQQQQQQYQQQPTKSITKPKKQYPEKNIHRYFTRQVIRQMAQGTGDCKQKITELCNAQEVDINEVTNYYLAKLEHFKNLKALQIYWIIEEDDPLIKFKTIFKEYYKWFLREKGTRYILQGQMANKQMYVKYKNSVLNYYIKHPKQFKCNQKCTSKKKKK